MMLYVNGGDIAKIGLGLLQDDRSAFVEAPEYVPASPEEFLRTIDAYLQKHSAQINGIVVVRGPGSATALRTTLSIVNTFAFTRSLPIFGVSLPKDADDRMVLVELVRATPIPLARPMYAQPARITVSKKDALRRS